MVAPERRDHAESPATTDGSDLTAFAHQHNRVETDRMGVHVLALFPIGEDIARPNVHGEGGLILRWACSAVEDETGRCEADVNGGAQRDHLLDHWISKASRLSREQQRKSRGFDEQSKSAQRTRNECSNSHKFRRAEERTEGGLIEGGQDEGRGWSEGKWPSENGQNERAW